MHEKSQPAKPSLTLRDVPTDVHLAIKRAQTDYNVENPGHRITVTDVVSVTVRDWVKRGGLLPKAGEWD